MRQITTIHRLIFLLTVLASQSLFARDFFEIRAIQVVREIPKQETASHNGDDEGTFLQVAVSTQKRIRSSTVYAKAYYYDQARQLIDKTDAPFPIEREPRQRYAMPVFFDNTNGQYLYFKISEKVLETKDWRVVVVFGDDHEADGIISPLGLMSTLRKYDFPESQKVFNPDNVKREGVNNPVREYVIQTGSKRQPQITLFLRAPVSVENMSEAKGVLAMCLLANNVGEIKRSLQEIESADQVGGVLRFAEKHKLVVICWGSTQLWDPRRNWDELQSKRDALLDAEFDRVAASWARAIDEIARREKIPNRNFLLWGCSGSAQYAMRLALRKPQYFLAVHVHVPSSFDDPTPGASRVMWCLTTGENEIGYERSLRFYAACRKLHYPIIYKAGVGLGHSRSRPTDELGLAFFEYALERAKDKQMASDPDWFGDAAYVGDIVNQDVYPIADINLVPETYRTILPTKSLADKWHE